MAVKYLGKADFDLRPDPTYPHITGQWEAYDITDDDYWKGGQEIETWCRETCGEYQVDWWAYQTPAWDCATFYFKPKHAILFKLVWMGA